MTDIYGSQVPTQDPERLSPSASASQELKYPQILLEASFDSLLTHSFPSTTTVTMEPAPHTPRAPPSLSESWASISDVEYSHEEDLQSETTDAGSLIDVHSANDVQSVRDDTPSEDDSSDDEHDIEPPPPPTQAQPDLQSSTHSKTPAASHYMSSSHSVDEITLNEPAFPPNSEQVLVKHSLTSFSESEATRLQLPGSPGEDYVGTLHMTLSKSPLPPSARDSFRLLILGPDYTESLRATLVNKVADALVASSSGLESSSPPSRYHVVPDSFGPGSQPAAAELIPVDRTLDVESFHSGIMGGEKSKSIILCNEHNLKRASSTFEERQRRYVVTSPGWQQPDLAIILTDNKDSADDRSSACSMMIFAKRLKIPMIVVRMDNDWNADFAPLIFADTGAQLCIEERPLSRDNVVRYLPLDLNTFSNLNAAQLGRHIACLVQEANDPFDEIPGRAAEQLNIGYDEMVCKAKGVMNEWAARAGATNPRRILHTLAVLAGVLIFLHSFMILKTSWNARYPGPVPGIINGMNTTTRSRVYIHGVPVTPSSTAPVTSSSTAVSVPLTLGSHAATATTFDVEKLGNLHLIVRSLHKASASQKYSLGVFRGKEYVETETNVLFPSVWSVRLPAAQAYGNLSVCLAKSKPPSKECIQVDFGEQSFASWVRVIIEHNEERLQQQLAGLHASLDDIRRSEKPRDVAKEAQKRLFELENAVKTSFNSRWTATSALRSRTIQHLRSRQHRAEQDFKEALRKTQARLFGWSSYNGYRTPFQNVLRTLNGLNVRARFQQMWDNKPEHIQSETLATSQERAHHIVRGLRARLRNRR